jgi:protein involved in temperature-dependent protein secretion
VLAELVALAPNAEELAKKLGSCAQAEQIFVERLSDARLAGERASFGQPPRHVLAYVKAMTEHAAGDGAAAAKTLALANAARPKTPGILATRTGDRVPFVDLLDSDDLTGPSIPFFYDGRVFDVSFAELKSLTFHAPEDPFEAMWRRVTFEMKSGTRGLVPMPALYAGSTVDADPYVRLGRQTSWDHARGYAVAKGLRDYWLFGAKGEKRVMGLDQIEKIEFGASVS